MNCFSRKCRKILESAATGHRAVLCTPRSKEAKTQGSCNTPHADSPAPVEAVNALTLAFSVRERFVE
jgi:hypothetical protein